MQAHKFSKGILYVIATPIGNLNDLSARAITALKEVDLIIAEDTRTSLKLLKHFDINTRVQSYHEHSGTTRTLALLDLLKEGKRLAMISDAGTPLISDPGYKLVDATLTAGIPLFSVPGPSALTAALAVCGLPLNRVLFEGFLPATDTARRKALTQLVAESRTMVFFEAPHRLKRCLNNMHAVFGESRRISMIREISKIHEQVHRCTLAEALIWLDANDNHTRGEHVLVVEGASEQTPDTQNQRHLLSLLMEELSVSRAARMAGKISGAAHQDLYQLALQIKKDSTR